MATGGCESSRLRGCALVAVLFLARAASAQVGVPAPSGLPSGASPPAAGATQTERPTDRLGRDTPRGTVLGFMSAVRKGATDAAPLYLNTNLRDRAAVDLAHKLYVVLDSRLPARLHELSSRPEGSLPNPLRPEQDIVGTIATASGPLEIVVERVDRGAQGSVWLFSRKTLALIPDVFDEVDVISLDRYLPDFLTRPRFGNVRLFEWLAFLLVIPLGYRLLGFLPGPVRLLVLALGIRWFLSTFDIPLVERQFWSATATMLATVAVVWLLLIGSASAERYIQRHFQGWRVPEMAPMLRIARRLTDALVIITGGLVTLHYFDFDVTAALTGLGIGGIAIALAAQKTLENVIGGLSIIFDKAVRVGDVLKLGDMVGTVDRIGLRSTRIRTLDRTILSVPNSQIANANIETLSARDKFWFHHVVGLRRETRSDRMRAAVDNIQRYLAGHPQVDATEPIIVRFFRLGAFSLDVEIFAYVFARDREAFLEAQQNMLLAVIEGVEEAGAELALPSQTLQFTDASLLAAVSGPADSERRFGDTFPEKTGESAPSLRAPGRT